MIVLDCKQGTPEWMQARLGIPTASGFSRIITPTGAASKQATTYMNQLLAEWALGHSLDEEWEGNYWTERGSDLEAEARSYYELTRGVTPERVGFVYKDISKLVGCSPDWLVGDEGGAEVKCPKASTHIGYLLESGGVPAQYKAQVQGSLWVTGRKWWDFVSYHPGLPEVLVRVDPDPEYQKAIEKHVGAFLVKMLKMRAKLRDRYEINSTEDRLRKSLAAVKSGMSLGDVGRMNR